MNCGQVQEKLSCYLDGVLDETTLEAIETHIEVCADCRKELEALQSVVGFASEVCEVDPPAYLSSAIRDAVARDRETAGECAACLDMLSEYIDGELAEADRTAVEVHLASCEFCAEELAMLRETVVSMAMVAEVEPPASLRGRIAAATTGRTRVAPVAALRDWVGSLITMPRLGWAAGTVAAAAAVASIWILQPGTNPAKPVATVTPVTPPSVVAETPKPKPASTVEVTITPAEKAVAVAVHKSARKINASQSNIRVAMIRKIETAEKPGASKPAIAAHSANPTAEPESAKVTPEAANVEEVAIKPTEETSAEKTPQHEESKMKIAISPGKIETNDEFFKDVKMSAQMRQRVDGAIKVDVINTKF